MTDTHVSVALLCALIECAWYWAKAYSVAKAYGVVVVYCWVLSYIQT